MLSKTIGCPMHLVLLVVSHMLAADAAPASYVCFFTRVCSVPLTLFVVMALRNYKCLPFSIMSRALYLPFPHPLYQRQNKDMPFYFSVFGYAACGA